MDIVNQSLAKMYKDVQAFVNEKVEGADYEKQLFDIKVIVEDVQSKIHKINRKLKRGDEYDKENLDRSTFSEDGELLGRGHERVSSQFLRASHKSSHKKAAINYPLIKSAPKSVLLKGTDIKRPDHDVEIISLLEEDYTSHSSFHSQSSPAYNQAEISGVSPTVGEILESEYASGQ